MKIRRMLFLLALPLAFFAGCSKSGSSAAADSGHAHKHEHKPPHGGTPVVLGDEHYHLEIVLDAATGKIQVYVFDGHLENFMRASIPTLEIEATAGGQSRTLVLRATANPATGETVGDTSLFEGQADWLKTTREFDAVLKAITVRGTTFTNVQFNFPKGNDEP